MVCLTLLARDVSLTPVLTIQKLPTVAVATTESQTFTQVTNTPASTIPSTSQIGVVVTSSTAEEPAAGKALTTIETFITTDAVTTVHHEPTTIDVSSSPTTPSTTAAPKSSTAGWPALTTIFKPPESCLTNLYDVSGSDVLTLAPTELPECYPSHMYTTFSPGLCPSGYTVGLEETRHSLYAGALSTVIETAGYCCPSAFRYTNSTCLHVINAPVTFPGLPPSLSTPESTFSATLVDILEDGPITTYALTTDIMTNGVLSITAPVFYVRFQASDTELASSWSSITSSQSSEIASLLSTGNGSTIMGRENQEPSGLSAGTIAGIAIGAAVALLLFISAIIFWLKKRKREKKTDIVVHHAGPGDDDELWPKEAPPSELLSTNGPTGVRQYPDGLYVPRYDVYELPEQRSPSRGTAELADNNQVMGLARFPSLMKGLVYS